MEDCSKVGVRSIDDKRKFMALAEDLRHQQRVKLTKAIATTTTSPLQSRKRPLKSEKTPPEKVARRLTLAHQTLPRTSISPKASTTSRVTNVNSRRLSYLPRLPFSNRSPVRNDKTSTVSPSRPTTSKTPPKMPKFLEQMSVEVKVDNDQAQIQKQGRLLDAYGIPVDPSKRRSSMEGAAPRMSFEEYVKMRESRAQHPATTSNDLHQRIRVCVRKRPLSKKETDLGETDIAPVVGARTVQINEPK